MTVRRGTAAVTRRHPEDDLDLPLLRALVAGRATVEDPGKPLSPDELRLLGEVKVPESHIFSLRDFAEIEEALDQEYDDEGGDL